VTQGHCNGKDTVWCHVITVLSPVQNTRTFRYIEPGKKVNRGGN
jgi:hypothetical protein